VILDNLSKGYEKLVKWGKFIKGEVGDRVLLEQTFAENNFDLVVHCAAFIEVGESVKEPEKYYQNNFANTVILLQTMRKFGVKRILFSSTAATYGEPKYVPIDELHTQVPVNPYGRSKLMVEQLFADARLAWGLEYVIFRFFNVCGASSDGTVGQLYEPATHLMAACFEAIVGKRPEMKLFGTDWETKDGTCVRDYIHVEDLALAHSLAIKYLDNGGKSDCFNLGSGKGYTVREVIESVKRVTGKDFRVEEVGRREGDPMTLLASSQKAKDKLGWEPKWTELDKIVESAWMWFKKNN
jgi:UDP-glucose 4-epimerase